MINEILCVIILFLVFYVMWHKNKYEKLKLEYEKLQHENNVNYKLLKEMNDKNVSYCVNYEKLLKNYNNILYSLQLRHMDNFVLR